MIGIFNFFDTIKPFVFLVWILIQIIFFCDIFLSEGKYTIKLIDLLDKLKKL